jgi:hypothetical protein
MEALHWTGAALLLAVAVLGGRSAPVERQPVVSWTDFAREHGIDADERTPAQRMAERRSREVIS